MRNNIMDVGVLPTPVKDVEMSRDVARIIEMVEECKECSGHPIM